MPKNLFFKLSFRTLLVIFVSLIAIPSQAQQEEKIALSDSLQKFEQRGEYERALPLIDQIADSDTLSFSTFQSCFFTFSALNLYQECISFCDKRLTKSADALEPLLYDAKAYCYFMLDDMEQAAFYYEKAIKIMEEEYSRELLHSYAFYATALKTMHCYKEAQDNYESFAMRLAKSQGLSLDEIWKADNAGAYGYWLYEYAYNQFFQGKEEEGMKMLYLAKQCGYDAAVDDYHRLSNSVTFNRDIKYKNKTLLAFEQYLESLDVYKHLPTSNAFAFWRKIEKDNGECQKLFKAMNKSNRPRTLRQALDDMSRTKSLVDAVWNSSQSASLDDTETYLKKALCGDTIFIKQLSICQDKSVNAMATPDGKIFFTLPLVSRYQLKRDLLLAVGAHEMAHYVCRHSLIRAWKVRK